MAQNVIIAGASFSGVPAVDIPKSGGGTARFVDSSDANAAAGDILQGKTAYVGGVKLTGTLVPGITPSGTLSITENGTYNVTNYASANVQTAAYISDNLHNFATDKHEIYINNVDGAEILYAGWTATDYIPVDNSSIYFFNLSNIWCACYDANKNFVSFPTEGVRVQQFTDTRIKYFRASFADGNMANFNMQMIVSGELPPNIRTQSKTATDNGDVYPDSGYHLAKVTVDVPFQVYRTGSGVPPASLGNDGDLYFDLG